MNKDKIISGLQITCDELSFLVLKEREEKEKLKHDTEIERILIDIIECVDIDISILKSYFPKNGYINPFSDTFLIFMYENIHKLKRRLKWTELIDLSYNFDLMELDYNIKNNFKKPFSEYLKNISLKYLFEFKINNNFNQPDNEIPF